MRNEQAPGFAQLPAPVQRSEAATVTVTRSLGGSDTAEMSPWDVEEPTSFTLPDDK